MKLFLSTLCLSFSFVYASTAQEVRGYKAPASNVSCDSGYVTDRDALSGQVSEIFDGLEQQVSSIYAFDEETPFPDTDEFRAFFTELTTGLNPQPQAGSTLFDMYRCVDSASYSTTLERVNALKFKIHSQYHKNLLITMWENRFYNWSDTVFLNFMESANRLLILNKDCTPVLIGIAAFVEGDRFDTEKIQWAYPFCEGKKEPVDIYTILFAVKEAKRLPHVTGELIELFRKFPAQHFADFLARCNK